MAPAYRAATQGGPIPSPFSRRIVSLGGVGYRQVETADLGGEGHDHAETAVGFTVEMEDRTIVYTPPKRKLTVNEYQLMGEAGIFHEDDRVELLDGELYEMPPIGDDHMGTVIYLENRIGQRLAGRALVSTQNALRLSDYTEPEPDIVLLRTRADFYRTGKPEAADVLLLIEVARSSIEFDRLSKLPRYAAAGIVEVWIVNLADDQVEVYRDPAEGGYTTRTVHVRGDTIAPLALPDLALDVDEILG